MNRYCGLLLISLLTCNAYKFLVYSPIFGYSHMNFMGAIADTLTEAGHNVTLLMPIMDYEQQDKTGVKLSKNIIKVPTDPEVIELMRYKGEMLGKMWSMEPSLFGLMQVKKRERFVHHFLIFNRIPFQMADNMTKSFTYQCRSKFSVYIEKKRRKAIEFSIFSHHLVLLCLVEIYNDEVLLKQLEDEKFDVGIAETFEFCGFGVFELAKIPATIATFSGVHMDVIAEAIGEPIAPSYVPGAMATAGDRMNFVDRFKNILDVVFGKKFFESVFLSQIKAFRKKFGPEFKSYMELLPQASYVFTNSNPYLDYPRPMLHKTVPIGGVTVSFDPKKNKLSANFFRESLLKVFESMPDTTFIMKYEEEGSKIADHLPNVHLSTWFPQNALLADPRLTAFVTHGGLGSTTELAHQGKPAILIPIFADQPRNAQMLAKHGGGIVLTKFDLENPHKLKESLLRIFNDASFSQNAKRLSEMLVNQPISAKQLVVRHSEFAAKFGRLPNLDPYGRHLSFIQYYLLDVIFVVMSVTLVIVYISTKLLKKCFSLALKFFLRDSLLKVFESMPDTTFIMKYEEEGSKIADHLPNVHLSSWFPQNALLGKLDYIATTYYYTRKDSDGYYFNYLQNSSEPIKKLDKLGRIYEPADIAVSYPAI
ncbi:UDP-glucoronosyl and UDP-glucosyl transferase [Necator americanus]|uniref:glucuronosyltransferase n=1 Tax=Necator americanus TaxID=51031 RepID=W2SJY1_NECAM|nr:UDP-glucoronosyl and UDP-glucosyl transferase [Necator americanus]ETN69959.1 UDP-glucoronosyl and UDP-glucosyl transferase [Necator americanus]